ncbi:putative protein N(5)-glutamine methyltransferase [Saccharopolyspora thermophila]|uniref:peptide chain release factor N(5)-glutamine methyltransferase n=1 Tax=Saccharopolyspora thermophila TaxID=89367 RepID=A0ABN1CZ16_9PSEU
MFGCPPVSSVVDRLRAAGCVFAEQEAQLLLAEAGSPAQLERMVSRRVEGLPLEVVLGWVRFCGLRIAVEPGVFVPRRRTQLLARQAVALTHPGSVVVDLCCGSAAVAAVVADSVTDTQVHAADIDAAAVRCARRNLPGGRVHQGDLFEPLPGALRGQVEVVVCNAPYVPSGQVAMLPPEAREHEPLVALDGGPDGLAVQRRVVASAAQWLAPGGHLLIESTRRQAETLAGLFTAAGLTVRVTTDPGAGATVVIGSRRASQGGPHDLREA